MKVAIIDDHKILAEAIKNTLINSPEIAEIKLFVSGDSFLNDNSSWFPDLIISDLLMPGKNGPELVKAYKEKGNNPLKIIILSSITNIPTIKHVIRQGANAYLSKEEPIEELLEAISKVVTGEQYIGKSLRNKLINNIFIEEQIIYHLSPREKDVLQWVCKGFVIKEVASQLNLSVHTVQSYHKNIMKKFKVNRTSDLINIAILNGFYTPDIKGL